MAASDRNCAALGCRDGADVVIRVDDSRERPVCEGHAGDGEVVEHV